MRLASVVHLRRLGFLALCVLLGSATSLLAQKVDRIANRDIAVHMVTNPQHGRFWITGGDDYRDAFGNDTLKFLYATDPSFVTSNVIFRITRGGVDTYYCNTPPTFGWRPVDPRTGQPMVYKAFDSVYVAPGKDTIAAVWKNLDGFQVTMRFVAERRTTVYDRGSDLLIEFDYALAPFASSAELGIMLMLDTYNSNAQTTSGSGGASDKSSVLSSRGYLPVNGFGARYAQPFDSIPEFYHVGNFTDNRPRNTIYPIHRLWGKSHGGAILTKPNAVAFGDWSAFRSSGWPIPSAVGSMTYVDCATIVRWEGLTYGTIRTAFGLSDRSGNNMFTCRDTAVFVDIRAPRLVEQKVKNGPYSPSQIEVEMWVTNMNDARPTDPLIRLGTPILSTPNNTQRVTLDPSTPAVMAVSLAPKETKKLTWKLNINPASTDTLVQLIFYDRLGTLPERVFREGCTPLITIKGFQETPPPPKDIMPPPINATGQGRSPMPYWTFKTFDRHAGYPDDTGLDNILVLENTNFTLTKSPAGFVRCDTRVDVDLTAAVIDSTLPGRLVYSVLDCAGNASYDTVIYAPRPDLYKPQVDSVRATGSTGTQCNNRRIDLWLSDIKNQTSSAGDNGFAANGISILSSDNFAPPTINFDNGGAPIVDFAPYVSMRLSVVDTMRDGSITIRVADYAGNADTLSFSYCTIPDTQAPRHTLTDLGASRSWRVDASDTQSWDRGLLDVKILANPGNNMLVALPTITPGDRTTSFQVDVIDDSKDAEVTLEIVDTYYTATPGGHADTLTIKFPRMPDERAPNVVFLPVKDSSSAVFDIEVNDIHQEGTGLYKYDLGLNTITVTTVTPNIELLSQPTFNRGDMKTTFRARVIDTLALSALGIDIRDSICVEATDLANNLGSNCHAYPILPDIESPRLVGVLDPSRSTISAVATDSLEYDRGIASITLENPVNLDPSFGLSGLSGARTHGFTLGVVDPRQPISGTLVVRDLLGELGSTSVLREEHTVRVPFALPVVSLELKLPDLVEGGTIVNAPLLVGSDFTGTEARTIDFAATFGGNAEFRSTTGAVAIVGAQSGSMLPLRVTLDPMRSYRPGDTLGTLVFFARQAGDYELLSISLDTLNGIVNGGASSTVPMVRNGDTLGLLTLPSPLLKLAGDSLTYINGTCSRALTTIRRTGKPTGPAILTVMPQPLRAGDLLSIDLVGMPDGGGTLELVASDGRLVHSTSVAGGAALRRVDVGLPKDLSSGSYYLRIRASNGTATAKVLVAE